LLKLEDEKNKSSTRRQRTRSVAPMLGKLNMDYFATGSPSVSVSSGVGFFHILQFQFPHNCNFPTTGAHKYRSTEGKKQPAGSETIIGQRRTLFTCQVPWEEYQGSLMEYEADSGSDSRFITPCESGNRNRENPQKTAD
jgi:hypothetical protein